MKKLKSIWFFSVIIVIGVVMVGIGGLNDGVSYETCVVHLDKTANELVYNEVVIETSTNVQTDNDETQENDVITEYIIENMDYINQVEDYPTGCESVASVMALNYMGIDISVDTFIDDYLDCGNSPYYSGNVLYAADPWEAFIGNPRSSSGYGCYSTVIENAINKFIDTDTYKVFTYNEFTTQLSLEEICGEFISNDIPVLIWATASMKTVYNSTLWTIEGTSDKFQWLSPMHCLVLVGFDEDYYYFHDSLEDAYTKYSKSKVETAYEAMGSQALAIVKY
ncbi:MAG: C39 family peptidase [Clostridia bacterium]